MCAPLASRIAVSTSAVPYAIASSAARAMCARPVPRVSPTMVPRAFGSQCGAPSPVSAGTKYTPPVESIERASASVSLALLDDAESVAQPLHRRAGDEDRGLERVRRLRRARRSAIVVSIPLRAGRSLAAGVQQQKRARSVGVLAGARVEAPLTEQRGLLVAGDAHESAPRRRARRRAPRRSRRLDGRTSGSIATARRTCRTARRSTRARRCRRASCATRWSDRWRGRRRR